MRLALAAGELDVAALLARISARQLDLWLAYFSIEPWGARQDDMRSLALAELLANPWRKKGARQARPSELFPHLKLRRRPRTLKEFLRGKPSQAELQAKIRGKFAAIRAQHGQV